MSAVSAAGGARRASSVRPPYLKCTIFGAITAIVCCYEDVFTQTLLAIHPEINIIR